MFKWVLGLCLSMYLTLLIFGAPPQEGTDVAVETPAVGAGPVETVARDTPSVEEDTVEAKPVAVAETTTAEIATAIASSPVSVTSLTPAVVTAPLPETVELATATSEPVQVAETAPVETAPVEPTAISQIWTVTGSRVNLRDLPGTNGAVIGQTRRGNSAEIIELLDNGWARVFILESGLEAYMSADFLSDRQS